MEGIGRRRRGLLDLLRAIDGRAIYDDNDVDDDDDDDGRDDDEIRVLERDATRMLMHANRRARRRGLFDSDPAMPSLCHVRAWMTMSELSSSNATNATANANAGGGGGEKKRRCNGGGGGGRWDPPRRRRRVPVGVVLRHTTRFAFRRRPERRRRRRSRATRGRRGGKPTTRPHY